MLARLRDRNPPAHEVMRCWGCTTDPRGPPRFVRELDAMLAPALFRELGIFSAWKQEASSVLHPKFIIVSSVHAYTPNPTLRRGAP